MTHQLNHNLANFRDKLFNLEEEIQLLTAEKISRAAEVESSKKIIQSLYDQIRYTEEKLKQEFEQAKESSIMKTSKEYDCVSEENIKKEQNLVLIEAARGEQSLLRDAIRNVKKEKIRLTQQMELFQDKKLALKSPIKQEPEALKEVDMTKMETLIQECYEKDKILEQEVIQAQNVASGHIDRLIATVKRIEKLLEKKRKLLSLIGGKVSVDRSVKVECSKYTVSSSVKKNDDKTSYSYENSEDTKVFNPTETKIHNIEKEIEAKNQQLEANLKLIGELMSNDNDKKAADCANQIIEIKAQLAQEVQRRNTIENSRMDGNESKSNGNELVPQSNSSPQTSDSNRIENILIVDENDLTAEQENKSRDSDELTEETSQVEKNITLVTIS